MACDTETSSSSHLAVSAVAIHRGNVLKLDLEC